MTTQKDIYEYHDELQEKLKTTGTVVECSRHFKNLEDSSTRIKYSLELLAKHNILQDYKKFIPKCNTKSLEYRNNGNKYFSLKNQNYVNALELYNRSICFAEPNSEHLAIGYANRSAIYFEWGEYQKCLKNIELARKSPGYPQKLNEKLNRREKLTLEIINNDEDHEESDEIETPNLSYPLHEKVPFIVECLELVEDQQFGRYIVTNKDLKVGDLIAIDEPFALTLQPELSYRRCATCRKENCYFLIPCSNCTQTMFCSQECQETGNNLFHRFECTAIDGLISLFNTIHLSALRTVLKVIADPVEFIKIKQFIENLDESTVNPFTINYADHSICERYKPIHTLATNQSKRNMADLFQRSTLGAILYKFLADNTNLMDIFAAAPENENIFLNLLFRHLQTSATNFHSIGTIEIQTDIDLTFASGPYGFASMINHSCSPNITRYTLNQEKMMIFVQRPIKKGGQIFDNYGYHHCLMSRELRQSKLKQYNFTCACEACVENYPEYLMLPQPKNIPEIVLYSDAMGLLVDLDYQFAYANYESYINFLEQYDRYYPCGQICNVQEALKMCWNIFFFNIPLHVQKKGPEVCNCIQAYLREKLYSKIFKNN